MRRLLRRLPPRAAIARRGPALAGFAFGALLPLALAALLAAGWSGGLSDGRAPLPAIYPPPD